MEFEKQNKQSSNNINLNNEVEPEDAIPILKPTLRIVHSESVRFLEIVNIRV